jgi:alkylation response protein AidB-like acyl-CoA dehydrogenase
MEQDDSIALIRDSAGALAPRGGDLRRIRALRFQDPGFDRASWGEICALGWPGLRVTEEAGGAGLGMHAFCALVEELGRGLVPEPLIPVAMSARLLQGDALAPLLAGERIVIPAWQERANTLDPGGAVANGSRVFIPMASGADAFLVIGADGMMLVPPDAPGASLAIERTQDGGNVGTLTLTAVKGEVVPLAPGLFQAALDEAALATSAYLLGAMDEAFALTLEYLRTRQQFGRVIGSFQALQHKAADLKLQIELTRASVESAAAICDAGAPPPQRSAAVSRAKARAADASLLVTREVVQLHGGIGYTDEHDAGLYLRKAMVLANLYGSAALHRARYAALAPEEVE